MDDRELLQQLMAAHDGGLTQAEVATLLDMSQPGINACFQRLKTAMQERCVKYNFRRAVLSPLQNIVRRPPAPSQLFPE